MKRNIFLIIIATMLLGLGTIKTDSQSSLRQAQDERDSVIATAMADSQGEEAMAQGQAMRYGNYTRDKEFVIVIPSYNNKEWYRINIDSALDQDYEKFHVIYIDDASTDGTGDLVEAYIRNHPRRDRFTLIRNKERIGALLNRYHIFHSIANHKIICELDGDDWFAHTRVLKTLNRAYLDSNVWLTFGQFKRVPQGTIGQSKPLPEEVLANNIYRTDGYYTSMLRTYYAWLYKKIHLQDLLFAGMPFHTCSDLAIMYPMVEMAREHCLYIDEILYMVNRMNALNTENVSTEEERALQHTILRQYKDKYAQLTGDLNQYLIPKAPKERINMVIYSNDNPVALKQLLESAQKFVRGITHTTIVYKATKATKEGYKILEETCPEYTFIKLSTKLFPDIIKTIMHRACTKYPSDYILFAKDSSVFVKFVDLALCRARLEQTKAHGFYLGISKNKSRPYAQRKMYPPFMQLAFGGDENSIYAWQFTGGKSEWLFPDNLNMVLYPTQTVLAQIAAIDVATIEDLAYIWGRKIDLDSLALCFGVAKTDANPFATTSGHKNISDEDSEYYDRSDQTEKQSEHTHIPLLCGALAGFGVIMSLLGTQN